MPINGVPYLAMTARGAGGEFRALVRMLWRRKWTILTVATLVLAAAFLFTLRQPKIYETSTGVIVALSDDGVLFDQSNDGRLQYERDIANELAYIRSDNLRAALADELGFVPVLKVESGRGDIFNFSVRGANPDQLADVANRSAEVYVQERNTRTTTRYVETLESVQSQIASLEAQDRALSDPIRQFRDSLDPFAMNANGTPVNSEAAIAAYEQRLAQLESDAAPDLALIAASRASLQRTLDELQLSANVRQGTARVSRQASTPSSPVSPNWLTNMILGTLAAGLCGIGAGATLEFFDKRILTIEDVQALAGKDVPIVEIVSAPVERGSEDRGPDVTLVHESSPESEAAQQLWSLNGLVRLIRDRVPTLVVGQQRVLITSAEPGAGKTFVASNLALTAALSGDDTLLVDLDLRRPNVHRMFDLSNDGGISALLADKPTQLVKRQENLQVHVAGRFEGNPVEVAARIEHEGFPDLWKNSTLLLVDTPPLLAAPDAAMWASSCDLVLLIARSGKTKRSDFADAIATVAQLEKEHVIVITDQKSTRSAYKYASMYRQMPAKSATKSKASAAS